MHNVNVCMTLHTNQKDPLSISGHLPLLAGFSADGSALFVADTYYTIDNRGTFITHVVADGTRPKDLRCRIHCTDGNRHDVYLYPHEYDGMYVLCLRYDPFVYESADSRSTDAIGMDATGTCSWVFNRKLPAERSEYDKRYWASVEGPHVLWEQVIH